MSKSAREDRLARGDARDACLARFTILPRHLDSLCPTRTSPQQLPSALPVTHLGYIWQDRVSSKDVLEPANTPSVLASLSQRRLHWFGHVRRMEDGRLPKDVLYGSRSVGRPMLRYKDVCERAMKSAEINPELWEAAAADRSNWRRVVRTGVKRAEAKREQLWHDRRERQRARASSVPSLSTVYICSKCSRDCHSRIGLYSHSRRCPVK